MTRERLLLFTTGLAYLLIGVEIVVMISPFALYFYSVYGPILDFLSLSPLTAWTTEFFLPHMVFLDDPLVLAVSYLQLLLPLGLLLFLTAAVPLYYGRFTGRGVVTASFYRKIRHPQYLFLAISGLGLLLYWPRFIILVLYVTMLFVYYFLARNEEWRMRREAPAEYEKYMAATPMFLPGNPGGRFYARFFGWLRPKWLGFVLFYGLSLSVAVGLALTLRAYTVSRLPVARTGEMTLVSVFPRPAAELETLFGSIRADEKAGRFLAENPSVNLAYVMPGDFFLTALVTEENRRFSDDIIERFPEVLEWHQHKFRGGLGKFFRIFYNFVRTLGTVETDYEVERFIFVTVADGKGIAGPENLFALGLDRTPALLVDIDGDSRRVLAVLETEPSHKWGGMPMPTF